MRVFDKEYLFDLIKSAPNNHRLREHLNLHKSYDEKVQRLFIAMSKGSLVTPHYHELSNQWEMFVVLEGLLEVTIYKQDGEKAKQFLVGDDQGCRAVEIHPFDIHSVECISDNALLLEIKEGPFTAESAKVSVEF